MSKFQRKVRREIRRKVDESWRGFYENVKTLKLSMRLKIAWKILTKRGGDL